MTTTATKATMSRQIVDALSPAKAKEWREWGKQAYKSTASMMRTNSHHPDYKTLEQQEAVHDRYGDSYLLLLTPERASVLREKWGYTDSAIAEAVNLYKEGYDASRKWYAREDVKMRAVIDRFASVWEEASRIAHAVDVSDIKDGFPCGSAHLYLQKYAEHEDLYKALGHFENASTDVYKYRLPIKMPSYGQCIAYDERICKVVNEFLRSKGVFAHVHSWID